MLQWALHFALSGTDGHETIIFICKSSKTPYRSGSVAELYTVSFLAIIPLASLLSFATEELAATMGQALGGLMNATFGNAVELIVSPLARALSKWCLV